MATYEANRPARGLPMLWLVESLIVIGVLAFGYFAITMDTSFFAPATVSQPADPLADLLR